MKKNLLSIDAWKAAEYVRRADLVVGVPSYNNARTAGHVIRSVYAGLAKYYPQLVAVVVSADAGSTDRTREEILAARCQDQHLVMLSTPSAAARGLYCSSNGITGKGCAHRLVFEVAARLGARACAIVDADLCSIDAGWIDALFRPVLQAHYDFVTPGYQQHKFDGGVTSQFLYPLTRSLYGVGVRHPAGSEFGLSSRLVNRLLEHNDWETTAARYSPGLWMTSLALAEGFGVCQSYLGPLHRDTRNSPVDLAGLLGQNVGSTFSLMQQHEAVWLNTTATRPAEQFGFADEVRSESVPVFADRSIAAFKLGCRDLAEVWRSVLGQLEWAAIRKLGQSTDLRDFRFSDELWVDVVAGFACAAKQRPFERSQILAAFTPIYQGRFASAVIEYEPLTGAETEARIEHLCAAFEAAKPELIAKWCGRPPKSDLRRLTNGIPTEGLHHGGNIPARI